jgi:hypothetical protein
VESDAIAATALSIWRLRTSLFKKGKHALAWAAMEAIPIIHYQPMVRTEGMKGCGGCHKIGLKSPEQVADLAKSGVRFGNASCNSCHTRHTFSVEEAKSPRVAKWRTSGAEGNKPRSLHFAPAKCFGASVGMTNYYITFGWGR